MEDKLFKMKGYKMILFYLTESYLAEYLSFVITPYSLVLYLHIVMMVIKMHYMCRLPTRITTAYLLTPNAI